MRDEDLLAILSALKAFFAVGCMVAAAKDWRAKKIQGLLLLLAIAVFLASFGSGLGFLQMVWIRLVSVLLLVSLLVLGWRVARKKQHLANSKMDV